MKLLTIEQQESYKNARICHICKEKFEKEYLKDEKCCKPRDHCYYTGEYCHYTREYRGALHNICNLKYTAPKKILKCFICGSNYDYHFIIKESAEELKEQFTCLGEVHKIYGSNRKRSYMN